MIPRLLESVVVVWSVVMSQGPAPHHVGGMMMMMKMMIIMIVLTVMVKVVGGSVD